MENPETTSGERGGGSMERVVMQFVNRYTGQPFELLPDKHPSGGLYVYVRNLETGETATFHLENLKTCFSPNDKLSDSHANDI